MKTIPTIVLTSIAFAAFPAMATSPLASDIAGQVVDSNKKPIAGAYVQIRHYPTNRIIARLTNSNGRYQAINLRPDGNYEVIVIHPTRPCFVHFAQAPVQLAARIRRNAVMCSDTDNPPAFMRSWQWKQSEAAAMDEIGPEAIETDANNFGNAYGSGVGSVAIDGWWKQDQPEDTAIDENRD